MSTRVLLADDHAMLREALRIFLEKNGITVVGEAEDGAAAVRMAQSLKPQLVIMDLSMPVMNGADAAEQIISSTGIPVIIVTMHMEESHVARAFRAGVSGFVLKSRTAAQLLTAITEVKSGHMYLGPGISNSVIREMLGKGPKKEALTLRERQVLQLVAEGKSTKELAGILGISERTGGSHRGHIMDKLNIRDTAGLVRYAIREGLIQA